MARARDKPIVLAVDDDEDLLALMSRVLSPACTVRTATEGPAALLAAAASPQPDLVLLDVQMQRMSGFEVCKALKPTRRPRTSRSSSSPARARHETR